MISNHVLLLSMSHHDSHLSLKLYKTKAMHSQVLCDGYLDRYCIAALKYHSFPLFSSLTQLCLSFSPAVRPFKIELCPIVLSKSWGKRRVVWCGCMILMVGVKSNDICKGVQKKTKNWSLVRSTCPLGALRPPILKVEDNALLRILHQCNAEIPRRNRQIAVCYFHGSIAILLSPNFRPLFATK